MIVACDQCGSIYYREYLSKSEYCPFCAAHSRLAAGPPREEPIPDCPTCGERHLGGMPCGMAAEWKEPRPEPGAGGEDEFVDRCDPKHMPRTMMEDYVRRLRSDLAAAREERDRATEFARDEMASIERLTQDYNAARREASEAKERAEEAERERDDARRYRLAIHRIFHPNTSAEDIEHRFKVLARRAETAEREAARFQGELTEAVLAGERMREALEAFPAEGNDRDAVVRWNYQVRAPALAPSPDPEGGGE